MNQKRYKAILKLVAEINTIKDQLEDLQSEEEEAKESTPEPFFERHERMEAAIDAMENAINDLDSAVSGLEGIQ